jgi:hypothetical protein
MYRVVEGVEDSDLLRAAEVAEERVDGLLFPRVDKVGLVHAADRLGSVGEEACEGLLA